MSQALTLAYERGPHVFLVGIGLIVAMLLVIRHNDAVAEFMTWFSTSDRPTHQLIREDRPEKLEQMRESRTAHNQMMRVLVVVWAAAVIVLIALLLLGVLPE
jgi:uncharacterized integral membrane protein